jgi:methyltransferase family protein
MIVTKRVAQ